VLFHKAMKRAADYPKRPGAEIPPFGVYRYATRGSEGIEGLIVSSGHRYSCMSAVGLTATRCGPSERWQPLVNRWTVNGLCLGPRSSRVAAVSEFHEFFGKAMLGSYGCLGGSVPSPSILLPRMSG